MTFKSTNNGLSSLILFVFLLTGCFFDLNGQNCNIPSNVVSGNITPTTATFNWDAMPNATAYEVNYRPMNAPATQPWNTVSAPTNTATINALTPSTMYDVQVRSLCGADFSDYTVTTSFSTQNCVPPMNPAISNITANSADIQWTAVPGASGYQLLHRIAVSGGNPGAWNATAVTGNNYTLTGLVTNTLYAGRLITNCGDFPSDTSKVFYFSTNPCSVPAHLLITAQTASSVSLSWDAVPNANQYNVQYRTAGNGTWSTVNTNTNSRTINSLTGNTSYEFRVRSNCGGGVTSAYTLIISGFTLPCAMPENAIISNVAVNSATVSWNNATGANQYRVDYREALAPTWTTINANNTTKTINNLQPNTAYEVQVRSRCSGNQYSANTETLTFQTKSCAVPQNFQATNVQYTSAQLGWNAVENATRYQLQYRLVGDTSWTTTNPDSTVRMVNGLTPNSTYEARVRTKCANDVFSDYSPVIIFSTTLCAVPQNLQITNVTFDQARFSWTAVPNATRYQVEYRVVGDTLWHNATSDSAFKVLNNLNPGATYEARVRSRCANHVFSDWTWVIFFETPACVAPRNIMGGYRSNTSVELVWDGSPTAQLYQIGYRLAGDTVWTHQVNSDSNRKVLNQLTLGNLYDVRVRSKCANGVFSDWVNGTVFHTEACAAPTNLQVVAYDSVRYKASWDSIGAVLYVFSYLSDDMPDRTYLKTSDNELILTNWNSCTHYNFRVYAVCDWEQDQNSLAVESNYQTEIISPCGNTPPVGVEDFVDVPYNQTITHNVLTNDTDFEGDPLSFDPLNPPYLDNSPGQIIVNGNNITYVPDTTQYVHYIQIVYTPFDGIKRGQKTNFWIRSEKTSDNVCSCNMVKNGDFEQGKIPNNGDDAQIKSGFDYNRILNYSWEPMSNSPDLLDKRCKNCDDPSEDGWGLVSPEFFSGKPLSINGNRALRMQVGRYFNSNIIEGSRIRLLCTTPGTYKLTYKAWAGSRATDHNHEELRISLRNRDNNLIGVTDEVLEQNGAKVIARQSIAHGNSSLTSYESAKFCITEADIQNGIDYLCVESIVIGNNHCSWKPQHLKGEYTCNAIVVDDICLRQVEGNPVSCPRVEGDCNTNNAYLRIEKKVDGTFTNNGKKFVRFRINVQNNGANYDSDYEPSSIVLRDWISQGDLTYVRSEPQDFVVTNPQAKTWDITVNRRIVLGDNIFYLVFEAGKDETLCRYINNILILKIGNCFLPSAPNASKIQATAIIEPDCHLTKEINEVPDFEGDVILCPGDRFTLKVNGTNGIPYTIKQIGLNPGPTRQYNADDVITFTPISTTRYEITYQLPDGCICGRSFSAVIYDLRPNYNSQQAICVGTGNEPISYTIVGSVFSSRFPNPTFLWSPTTHFVPEDEKTKANPTLNLPPDFTGPITYTVTITGTNTKSGITCTATTQVTIVRGSLPQVSVNDLIMCPDQIRGRQLTATTQGEGPFTYSWSPANGLSNATISNPTVTLTTPGIYSYTVTVTDKNGCTAQATSRVEIAPVEAVYETPKIVCLSGIAFGPPPRLEGSVTPSQLQYNYSWSVPSSQARTYLSSLVVANPEIIRFPNAPTTVTYTLSAWTDEGCTTRTEVTVYFVLPPTVTLAPTITGCARQPISLLASSETGLFYRWEPLTGLSNPNIPNPTLTLNNSGTYTYTVTVKDANGCETRKSVTVTVAPTPALTVSGRDQLCPNSEDEISFSSEPAATFYTITTPTGTFTTDKDHAFFPINPSQTTTYTITAHLGNCSESETLTVHVPQISVAFNPQTVNTCSNSPITLAPSSVGQDVYYYTWTPATGLSNSGIRNPVFTPPGAGTYTYTLMVMNREQDPSCTATAQVTVTVRQAATITVTAPTEPLCPGETATLTATGSPQGGTYVWSHNLGSSPTVNVNPDQTTNYTVTYTQNGCSTTATATVTVKKVNPTVNIPPLCFGQPVTIDLVPNTESSYTITWSISPEVEFNGQGTNHLTFTPTGLSYAIQARFIAEGCTVSVNRLVNVGNSPTVSASASPATISCQNRPVTLTASGTAFTYHWLLPDNQTQIGNPIIVLPTQTTTYTVIGTATNGCTTSATVTVTVGHITIEESKVDVCDRFNRRKLCIKSPNPNSNYAWQLIGDAENQYFLNGVTTGSCITVLTTDVTKPIQISVSGFDDPCIHTQEFPASFPAGEVILADLGITTSEDLIGYYGVNNNTITPQTLGAGTMVINGTLVINSEELTLKDLNIIVRTDANGGMGGILLDDLVHAPRRDLNIYRCYIHSDLLPYQVNGNGARSIQGTNLWRGIRSGLFGGNGSTMLVFLDNTQIEHGEMAVGSTLIFPPEPSSMNIIARYTCFNQNEIHLNPQGRDKLTGEFQLYRDDRNVNTNTLLGWTSNLVLSACRLDCNAPLPGTLNNYTKVGIHFTLNGSGVVGSPFADINNLPIWEPARNIFTRMSCGILTTPLPNHFEISTYGEYHINNNDFFDLIDAPDYPVKATAFVSSGGDERLFRPDQLQIEFGNHASNKIFRHPDIPTDATATGIYYAHKVGKFLVQRNVFEGITTGVKLDDLKNAINGFGEDGELRILNNNFKSVHTGTSLTVSTPWYFDVQNPYSNRAVDISFKSNILENIGFAGWGSSIIPARGPNIFIENNGFHRPNVTGQFADIWCWRTAAAEACSLTVRGNFINPQQGGQPSLNGVYVSGDHGTNSVIADNVIRNINGLTTIVNGEQGQPNIQIPNSSGIVVQNAPGIQIINNVLVNPNPTSQPNPVPRATGIRLINSPNSTITCNKIGEYNFGILGEGISPGSTLISNVMRFDVGNNPPLNPFTDVSGLTLYNNGNLGTQGSPAGSNYNMLSLCPPNTPNCYGALSVESDPQQLGMDVYVRQYSTNDGNSRNYSDNYSNFGLANQLIGAGNFLPITTITNGQLTNRCNGNNDQQWLSFVSATGTSELDILALENYQLPLFDAEGKYMYRQYLLDTIAKNPLLRLQSPALDSFYTVSLLKNVGTLYRIKQSITEGKNSAAEGLNEALVPQNKIERNHKQVNSIYFDFTRRNLQLEAQQRANPKLTIEQKLIQEDSLKAILKAEHYSVLCGIAEQCPLKGGKAVYEARAFRFHMDGQFRLYKDDCQEQPEAKVESRKSTSSDAEISIYPNPARETVNLNYNLPKDINATVEIFTASGSLTLTTQLSSGKGAKELSLNDLSEGIYLVSFRLSNGDLITKKLTIQR